MMRRVLTVLFILSWFMPIVFFSPVLRAQGSGQKTSRPEFDYESLAIDSILGVADKAAKLPDIEQKVALLIRASNLLPASRRDDAIRLLDMALGALKDWETSEKTNWGRRYKAATLRGEILSVYARLDSKKALEIQKESVAQADFDAGEADGTARPLRKQDWSADMVERHQRADGMLKVALSLMDTNFGRASALVVQSVKGGVVSSQLFDVLEKLKQPGDRARLNKLETAIGEALAQTITLDPSSLQFAPILIASDREMPLAARNGLILFFMNSLRTWVGLVRDESRDGGLDPSYVSMTYLSFFRSVRPAIAQYSPPEEASTFDLLLDQVSLLLPAQTKARLQTTAPETISNPRDRLADILKESNTRRRDIRLMRLALDSTRNSAPDELLKGLEFASETISHISDERLKGTINNFVVITRAGFMTKAKKFDDAQRIVESIPTIEVRVWTLLALSTVIHKEDGARALDLIHNAIKTLDAASPSARKVELALLAVAMLVKDDPLRALEMLSVSAKYANSKPSKVEIPDDDISSAIRLEASVGSMSTMLGNEPESLAEIKIDPSLSLMGRAKYWFQSQQIADDFHEMDLRLLLKLKFAEGALAKNQNPPKDAVQNSPIK